MARRLGTEVLSTIRGSTVTSSPTSRAPNPGGPSLSAGERLPTFRTPSFRQCDHPKRRCQVLVDWFCSCCCCLISDQLTLVADHPVLFDWWHFFVPRLIVRPKKSQRKNETGHEERHQLSLTFSMLYSPNRRRSFFFETANIIRYSDSTDLIQFDRIHRSVPSSLFPPYLVTFDRRCMLSTGTSFCLSRFTYCRLYNPVSCRKKKPYYLLLAVLYRSRSIHYACLLVN